jgi:methanogenic corrinoid protein MtbC1
MRSASDAGAFRDDYLSAVLAGDGTHARHVVDTALERGLDPETVCLEVLEPAMHEVGERWARGTIGVASEHLATNLTHGVLGALAPKLRRPPVGGRLAVVACTPGEQHALGAELVGLMLEGAGWEVLGLGASMPSHDLAALVGAEQPDVVGLSTSTAAMLPGALRTLKLLDTLHPRPCIVVGGRAWDFMAPGDVRRAGADERVAGPRELVAFASARFPPVEDDLAL